MPVKVTLLFNAGTVDSSGNAARSAGFSESYYNINPLDSQALQDDWQALCLARAQLMPRNVKICGSRYAAVDPIGGTRSYDNSYQGVSLDSALPGKALQWTVRSSSSPNQRSLILRGIPDARVVTGEYSPSAGYNAALINFFAVLKAKWKFRAIDRNVLPVKIVSITVGGLLTTVTPHGLAPFDRVNIMTTKFDDRGSDSYTAFVGLTPTANTAALYLPGRNDRFIPSTGGRVRKALIHYPAFDITTNEVIQPTAIFRKVGSPFRRFRGRRTANH